MADCLKYFVQFFECCFENNFEKKIIENNFNIEYTGNGIIGYSINVKQLRKLKLLSLGNKDVYFLIDKILKKSKVKDISEVIEIKLSIELTTEINRQIINRIFNSY